MSKNLLKLVLISAIGLSANFVTPCTRVVYHGDKNHIITARSMDWKRDIGTNLWIFPSQVKRTGMAGPNSIKWTSKYGSVIATGYDIATTDGVNEKGLVTNLLWLVESKYPNPKNSSKATLSLALWAQYVLDNYATVDEAVKAMKKEPFIVVTKEVPGETRLAALHLAISDSSGDSAIIEYVDGKQVIYHQRDYQVLTNSPVFNEQLAINSYWQKIGGTSMLPGTNKASDRFARASFYINAIPKNGPSQQQLASVFSVIRNTSVPFGLNTEEEPNISSTRWRTVYDHLQNKYYFESAVSPNVFWIDLNELNFKDGQTKKLELGADQGNNYIGKVNDSFKKATPFTFLGI